jgi:uncharacterized protein YkwD
MNQAMFRHVTLAVIGLLVAALLWTSACAPEPRRLYTGPGVEVPRTDLDLNALVELHNKERAEAKLPPLVLNTELKAAAKLQARDMAENEKMSHTGSDKSSPSERLKRIGYHYRSAAENVAYGQNTVEEVMRSWMNSRSHRKNILGNYTEIGAAVAYSKDGTPYWCVDFGRPWSQLDPNEAAKKTLDLINTARRKSDKGELTRAPDLASAAERHAKDMATRDELNRDEEAKVPTAIERLGEGDKRGYASLSESDASGEDTPRDLIDGWLEDADQSQSLMGDFDRLGVGYAIAAADGRPFWCVLLAKTQ